MQWVVFGDIHESVSKLAAIPELPGADGVLVSGDITNRGGEETARRVFSAISAINPRILSVPGNMDTQGVEDFLEAQGYNIHRKVRELAPGLGVVGVGYSTPTPFNTPGEVSEGQLGAWLDGIRNGLDGFDQLVAVIHTPPHGTKTDVLHNGTHVGSPAVRRFLEAVRPAVCISGHIHESRGMDRVGDTVVVNPGMLADGGYAVVEYDGAAVSVRLGQA